MPPPKTVLQKVALAITNLKDHAGSSRQAITKYCKTEFDLSNAAALKKALKTGVAKGTLVAVGARFTLPGVSFEAPTEEQLTIETLAGGTGDTAADGDDVVVSYVGTLMDGTQFDSAKRFPFALGAGEVIKGWDQGVVGMQIGEKRKLIVPPKLGYGKRGSPPEIPGNSTLLFVVTLISIGA